MASSATIRGGEATCDLLNLRRLGTAAAPIRPGSVALRRRAPVRSAAITASPSAAPASRRRDGGGAAAVAYEKLDEWMRDSVADIVRNLRRAPLMVHVYGGDAVVVEKAEEWSEAKGRWESGRSPMPEGLIFVEELSDRRGGDGDGDGDGESVSDGVTRAFGVVVQGRGSEWPPVCYLLKTSEAGFGYGSGLGLGCTHFSLVRVNGFRETTESQLKNSWLM